MISLWDGKNVAGSTSDHISAFWDFLPTAAEIAGLQAPENIDGISYLSELLGKEQKQHEYLYWEFHELGGRQAVRKGDWKLISYQVFDPAKTTIELFNLADDISEENNVAEKHPEIVKELLNLMSSDRTDSEDFPFQQPENTQQ